MDKRDIMCTYPVYNGEVRISWIGLVSFGVIPLVQFEEPNTGHCTHKETKETWGEPRKKGNEIISNKLVNNHALTPIAYRLTGYQLTTTSLPELRWRTSPKLLHANYRTKLWSARIHRHPLSFRQRSGPRLHPGPEQGGRTERKMLEASLPSSPTKNKRFTADQKPTI